jgi:CheY-like chemotaxis protein
MNLLGNAVKFTEEGGVVLRVFPAPVKGDSGEANHEEDSREIQRLTFEVSDTGPGIPESELETIFDPFIQSQVGQHTQEGTGLGLSISRQFAQLMSGELTVRSQAGKGSTFTFTLPVRVLESYQVETAPPQQVVGLAPNSPSYRLLVVDDKEVNRALLVKMLAPLGFEVREAADGLQACEIWEAWEPHLIWMDMRMPVMDGYEATRRIKSATKGQATVIVALTASALEEDREVILSEGCDDYIRKPFRENDLLEALERHLGVQFIYQEVPEVKGRPASYEALPGKELAQDELASRIPVVPKDLLEALYQATIQGYLNGMIARIDEINAFDEELARGLTKLANAFEHEKILSIIQLALEAK